jgi:hypothetical protein
MFSLRGPQGQNPRTTCGPQTTVWETLLYPIKAELSYYSLKRCIGVRMDTNRTPKHALQYRAKWQRNIGGRDGRTNFILRVKEQETRLTLHEHHDDDDDEFSDMWYHLHMHGVTDMCKVLLWWRNWFENELHIDLVKHSKCQHVSYFLSV